MNGVDRAKSGNSLYGAYGQDFVLADGRRIMVIGLTDRQWRGLVQTTGTGDALDALAKRLGTDLRREGARWEHRHAITETLRPWFATRTLAEVGPMFDGAGLTWSVFRSFAQAVAEDPDLSPDNPMMAEIDQPGIGRYPVPGLAATFSALDRDPPRPAPELGADTEAVLADVAGLPSGEIGRLFDAGIVGGPRPAQHPVAAPQRS